MFVTFVSSKIICEKDLLKNIHVNRSIRVKRSGGFHRRQKDVGFALRKRCEESGEMLDLIMQYLGKF